MASDDSGDTEGLGGADGGLGKIYMERSSSVKGSVWSLSSRGFEYSGCEDQYEDGWLVR